MEHEKYDIKDILADRKMTAYICSFAALGLFAYVLLVKYDIGGIMRSSRELIEADKNLSKIKNLIGLK